MSNYMSIAEVKLPEDVCYTFSLHDHTWPGNILCYVGEYAVGGYCRVFSRGCSKYWDICHFVNRKAQGSNAFYEECSGKYLVSVIEHNSIYMFCVREDASLAWLGK